MASVPLAPRTSPIDIKTGAISREWSRYFQDLSVYFSTLATNTVSGGGTGATSFTDGGVLLGSGTGAITAMAVLADGSIIVGDGTGDPVPLAAFSSATGTLNVASGGTGATTASAAFTALKQAATTGATGVVNKATAIVDLNQTISDPPTQTEVQDISDKIDALLAAMRVAGQLTP